MPDTTQVLNRLLSILRKSFPQYLLYARPYNPPGDERVAEVFDEITAAQDSLADRISQQIEASGELADSGKFPIEFTDTHDLDIDFLLREAIGYQQQDIVAIESCAAATDLAPTAKSLAEETLGLAKGHLESLEELVNGKNPLASV